MQADFNPELGYPGRKRGCDVVESEERDNLRETAGQILNSLVVDANAVRKARRFFFVKWIRCRDRHLRRRDKALKETGGHKEEQENNSQRERFYSHGQEIDQDDAGQ